MRAASGRQQHAQVDAAATDVATRIAALFGRWPELTGFSVQEPDSLSKDRMRGAMPGALCVADVATQGWQGLGATQALCDDIGEVLYGLLDERPEALELLCGRTFARTLH